MSKEIEKIIKNINDDRQILKQFLNDLINNCDVQSYVGIAEYVAKLSEALTHQYQTSIAAAKLVKNDDNSLNSELLSNEIGLPFADEKN